jgi:hypothetical protein
MKMDWDDYDDRKSEVLSNAEDYTEDEKLIVFFDNVAHSETKSIQEHGEFNAENAMEESQDYLDAILELYEEFNKEVDFYKVLDLENNEGGEISTEDLKTNVFDIVYKEILLKRFEEYNKDIKKHLTKKHQVIMDSIAEYIDIPSYKKEIEELKNEEETTELLIRIKIEILNKEVIKTIKLENNKNKEVVFEFDNNEKDFIKLFITKMVLEDYNQHIDNLEDDLKSKQALPNHLYRSNEHYIRDFSKAMKIYTENKDVIISDKTFDLNNYERIEDLIYNIKKTTLLQLNINNFNEKTNFHNTKINHLQKHLLSIMDNEVLRGLNNTKCDAVQYKYENILKTSIKEKISPSEKIIETFNQYKKYEALFKNHKKLPEDNVLHFDILKNNDIEEIDDFFQLAIERNQIKLYAKRFLGSYLKLMNEDSYDLFRIIKEKDINKNLIRTELQKIALYKDSSTLNNVLNKLINLNNLSVTKIMCDINDKKLDVDFIENKKELLVLTPNDYKSSSALGSSQWCISNSNYYFNNYLNKGNNKRNHVFIYDFNKKESDLLSKIAFTIDSDGQITDAFNKNNKCIKNIIEQIVPVETLDKIKDRLSYLNKNESNYNIYKKMKDEKIITKEMISEKIDNPIEFYSYLIKTNKFNFFINEFINSKESLMEVIGDSIKQDPDKMEKVIEFKDIVESENESIKISLKEINKLKNDINNINDPSVLEKFLLEKTMNNEVLNKNKIKL